LKQLTVAALLALVFAERAGGDDRKPTASETELRHVAAAWQAAVEAKDANRIASFFAEDALAMYPKPAPTAGRGANRVAWAEFFRRPNATHPISTERVTISVSGEMGWTLGTFAAAYDEPGGRATGEGLYVAVWRKAGTRWEIVALSANPYPRDTWPKF
jgi:ketosteroid isomerase-like protein